MKTAVAIALVVCGTILIALPIIIGLTHDPEVFRDMDAVALEAQQDSETARSIACWVAGGVMVGVGVVLSIMAKGQRPVSP